MQQLDVLILPKECEVSVNLLRNEGLHLGSGSHADEDAGKDAVTRVAQRTRVNEEVGAVNRSRGR